MGRRFIWRVLMFAVATFLVLGVVFGAGIVLVATAVHLLPAPSSIRLVATLVLVLFFVILVAGLQRVRRIALDVGELVGAAERIEAGDYGVQVRERGPREARVLARAFNAMSARLATTDRNRRAFVADLGHELRTPLAVIRGQAEAIGDGLYPGDEPHLVPILDATRSLESLVEALPTLTLADVGALRLKREPVEVGVLIHSSVAAFQAMADAAGVQLESELAPEIPPIDADPARIRGVLMNLLSNAIRHTPSGGTVTVSARQAGKEVAIAVRDTGQGIPEDLRQHVFDRFVKGAGSPGAGLGLAISRDVVAAHGGTINLTSEVGKGTEVRFSLPIYSSDR
ncbi:MAG TPA: HAMP domain-containing sensor histidine kinase [Candidatus Dormibacteraeota bacterium]